MKKELFILICGSLFLAMMIIAAFNHPAVQTASAEMLHEIKTADVWHGAAYTPVAINQGNGSFVQQGAVPDGTLVPVAFPYPNGVAGNYPQYQVQSFPVAPDPNQAAAFQPQQAAFVPVPDKPVLIKKFGAEVVPISGGKVKITGVMGNSWAQKAGLLPGDILLTFDGKDITDLKQFEGLVTKAAPEMNFKVVYFRDGRKKKCLITLGEGEMDGFLPIVVPK